MTHSQGIQVLRAPFLLHVSRSTGLAHSDNLEFDELIGILGKLLGELSQGTRRVACRSGRTRLDSQQFSHGAPLNAEKAVI